MGFQTLQAGIDFPSNFEKDNFDSRRTTGNNQFNPDSLITGGELEQGFTYTNSRRVWFSRADYLDAVHGRESRNGLLWDVQSIIDFAPRRSILGRIQIGEGGTDEGRPSFTR